MRTVTVILLTALCACGNSSGQSTPPTSQQPVQKSGAVVFVGDSITEQWPLEQYAPGAINLGVSGEETWQMLERFDEALSYQPATVVILGGINDIRDNTSASTRDLFEMVRLARESGARVIVGTLLPADLNMGQYIEVERTLIPVMNDKIRKGAAEHGYTVVDYHSAIEQAGGLSDALYADRYLHPNRTGYDVMWSALSNALN